MHWARKTHGSLDSVKHMLSIAAASGIARKLGRKKCYMREAFVVGIVSQLEEKRKKHICSKNCNFPLVKSSQCDKLIIFYNGALNEQKYIYF
jgi:hypothetical protein